MNHDFEGVWKDNLDYFNVLFQNLCDSIYEGHGKP
jgi:hypothetical protein